MNGLEFVTRRTEKTGNSNDVVGRGGKKTEATKRVIFASRKTCRIHAFCGHQLLSSYTFKSVMKQLFVSL